MVADVIPSQKLATISELQNAGGVVAMDGDDMNDMPAMLK